MDEKCEKCGAEVKSEYLCFKCEDCVDCCSKNPCCVREDE